MAIQQARRSRDMVQARPASASAAEQLANGLGWFSIGLGIAELAAPGSVARLIGVRDDEDNRRVLRTAGVREIASGLGILATPEPESLMWGRVAGDVMDLCLLGMALGSDETDRGRIGMATMAVAGVAALDVLAAQQLRSGADGIERGISYVRESSGSLAEGVGRSVGNVRRRLTAESGVEVTKVITINKPREEVYRFWRDFQNLPRFMSHLESVQLEEGGRSRWRAKAPAGTAVEWHAETTVDRSGELIAWRSLPGADVENHGSVQFADAPGGRGTEVRVQLSYQPPAGVLGKIVAKLFGEEPSQQIERDLRQLKAVMETGEVVHSDASIHRGPHAAVPYQSRPASLTRPGDATPSRQ